MCTEQKYHYCIIFSIYLPFLLHFECPYLWYKWKHKVSKRCPLRSFYIKTKQTGRIMMMNDSSLGFHLYVCIYHLKWLNIWTLITSGFSNDKDSLFNITFIFPGLMNLWIEIYSLTQFLASFFQRKLALDPHYDISSYVAAGAHSRNPHSCKAAVNSLDIKPALNDLDKMGFSSALFHNLYHNIFH